MFDLDTLIAAGQPARQRPPQLAANSGYHGPERRSTAMQGSRLLSLMLDEVGYGMVLLSENFHVLLLNHAARAELDDDHPLQVVGRELRARRPQDMAPLQDALTAARRGLRRLVTLGERHEPFSMAVVPLGAQTTGAPQATLLQLGKKRVCENLSMQWFARTHALTPAETRVLEALCQGLEPREVADLHGVGLATVRTQIGSIRAKTGAESIRALVRRLAVLPPMVSSLRAAA